MNRILAFIVLILIVVLLAMSMPRCAAWKSEAIGGAFAIGDRCAR